MDRKVVLITGGAMGQGKAHAIRFAENGFDVVLADMQYPEGETFKATVKEIESLGAKALAIKANVTSDSDMKALFEKAWETFGRLDVAVANAGVINFGYTWELTDEQVQKVIDIDLIGTWRTDKYAALYMKKQGFGRIINISSTSGMYGTPKLVTYCMAKWGVILNTISNLEKSSRQSRIYRISAQIFSRFLLVFSITITLPCPRYIFPILHILIFFSVSNNENDT